MSVSARMLLLSAALVSAAPSVGLAQPKPAKPSNAQKMQEAAVSDIPHCTRKLGTVSIANGDDPFGWMVEARALRVALNARLPHLPARKAGRWPSPYRA